MKLLVSLLSPFRQTIPRRTTGAKVHEVHRILTAAQAASVFTTDGTASNAIAITKDSVTITSKEYGALGSYTWASQFTGALTNEDVKQRIRTLNLLIALQKEEGAIFGGNVTALGTPTGLTTTPATTGAAAVGGVGIAAATYQVRVAALTHEGMVTASRVARTDRTAAQNFDASLVVPTVSATVGITAAQANVAAVVGGTGDGIIGLVWAAIAGAMGYAVYVDNKLQCVLPAQTKVTLVGINTTGAAVPSADSSANANAFNGILPQIVAAASGFAKKRVNTNLGTPVGNQLTPIADAIQDCYDRFRGPLKFRLVTNWDIHDQIDRKLSAVANDRIHINYNAGPGGVQFQQIQYYPSPVDGTQIPIETNPNLPGGMILGVLDSIDVPDANIPAAWEMLMGSDFVQLDYAMTAPSESFEQRAFGALAGYAPSFQFVLYDIHRA